MRGFAEIKSDAVVQLAKLTHFERSTEQLDVPQPPLPYSENFDSPEDFICFLANMPKGGHDSFGATPLNRAITFHDQMELETTLRKRTYNIPRGVTMNIANYIQHTFASRFHNRAEANEDNYQTSLSFGNEFERIDGVNEMYTRGELGEASPAELLVIRSMKHIRSVELACVTHPYGNEIKLLDPMHDAVQSSVEFLGGEYLANPEENERYRIKDAVRDEESGDVVGYLMTRKRTLGLMPDGTEIRERSSYLLQIDPEIIDALHGVGASTVLNDYELALDLFKLDELSAALLKNDQFSAAIPISSTIYAFNREDAAEIKIKAEKEKQIELQKFAKEYPLLYAVFQGDITSLGQEKSTRIDQVKRRLKVTPQILANTLSYLFVKTAYTPSTSEDRLK